MAEMLQLKQEPIEKIFTELRERVAKCNAQHPLYNSTHEGYGYLMEEVEEMFDEIKTNHTSRSILEAFDVAVVAVRYILSMRMKDALQTMGAGEKR